MSGQLSVEACQALREMGYDQPTEMYYYTNRSGAWAGPISEFFISDHLNYSPDDELACPDPLTAFDWIEREKGIVWQRRAFYSDGCYEWCAAKLGTQDGGTSKEMGEMCEATPSALILSIAKYVAQEGEEA
jgi:hypothetical protein